VKPLWWTSAIYSFVSVKQNNENRIHLTIGIRSSLKGPVNIQFYKEKQFFGGKLVKTVFSLIFKILLHFNLSHVLQTELKIQLWQNSSFSCHLQFPSLMSYMITRQNSWRNCCDPRSTMDWWRLESLWHHQMQLLNNSVSERKNRTPINMVKSMLSGRDDQRDFGLKLLCGPLMNWIEVLLYLLKIWHLNKLGVIWSLRFTILEFLGA